MILQKQRKFGEIRCCKSGFIKIYSLVAQNISKKFFRSKKIAFLGIYVLRRSNRIFINTKGHLRDTAEVSERDIIFLYDYPFSIPAENAVNKRIIEHHTPTALSSVKTPFWWCVSGITTFFYSIYLLCVCCHSIVDGLKF